MKRYRHIIIFSLIGLVVMTFTAGCGADKMPVYFEPPDEGSAGDPSTGDPSGAGICSVTYESQLCVVIKGDDIEAGTDESDPLCVEVAPIPIHINGTQVEIRGSEFPDILVEGHGLPIPITINARGNGDGVSNVGQGTLDAEDNLSVDNFSFYIVALGMVGEIPGLTLTTGTTDDLPHLPAISGSAPDASGAMTMVTGTVLGHLFDAADAILLGASLQATFTGSITPTLAECAGSSGPRSIEIAKVIIDENGAQIDAPIPDGTLISISSGTYIAQSASDIGPRFEASAMFRVTNAGSHTVEVNLPARVSAFSITSKEALAQELAPQRSFIITVSFHPTMETTEPGDVEERLVIGTDMFTLHGVALASGGTASIDTVDDNGNTSRPHVDEVNVGESAVQVNARRSYFQCDEIDCDGSPGYTNCVPCADPTMNSCQLMALSTDSSPIAEVDDGCAPKHPDAALMYTIDLKGTTTTAISARKQVVAIRNTGINPLTITDIVLEYDADAKSTGEFHLSPDAIFMAESYDEIHTTGVAFPVTLQPYYKGVAEQSLYVVITYQPRDLIGHDGTAAGIGSTTTDRAVLRIVTEDSQITAEIVGSTSIRDVPPLELFIKTSTGLKQIDEGKSFPFKSITADTTDSAVPLFLKLADAATSLMRITAIEISSKSADSFEWLDTADKIASRAPAAGQGLRCSIPIVDESTGQMSGEIFDLEPVTLGNGFDLMPGAYSTETMPLFGCVNFHRDHTADTGKRLFEATLTVKAQTLDATNNPARNPDGSFQESVYPIKLIAAINPRTGRLVLRVTQTMSVILNPDFPGSSSTASLEEFEPAIARGDMAYDDQEVSLGALILDPFDEDTVYDLAGEKILNAPGDGITGVFRKLNTVISATDYDDPLLNDFSTLLHDATRPEGQRGIFEDFPNMPEGTRTNGWRLYTSTLSYPGPLAPPADRPELPSQCVVVNPCDPEDLKKFTDAGVGPGEKGACAFFYASAGRYGSPSVHTAEEMPGGEYQRMCTIADQPQNVLDINTGHYSLDGSIIFEEIALRFFGPTFIHNPGGPIGNVPPLDVVFHTAFTTGPIVPPTSEEDLNVLPDERIDIQHQEYKINLDDPTHINPQLCPRGVNNKILNGKTMSSWSYLAPFISKDEEGTIPAGCPQPGINDFTGGTAFIHGRPIDHETGTLTIVAPLKFGSANELSFAFKDIMMFVIINGWLCDPLGNEEMYEGARCYDVGFNDRDAVGQVSMTE